MKQIAERVVLHVISEPGDNTRYDYFVTENYDVFSFMPDHSTFAFPQTLHYYEIKEIEGIDQFNQYCKDILRKETKVNPHTLMECIRTAKELFIQHN